MSVGIRWPWIAAIAGLAAALTALFGTPLGLPPMDAGDFATASVVLGIPHSPGFPVQTMLGHAATLVPLGSFAWRISMLSALATGGIVAALVALVAQWSRTIWTPVAVGAAALAATAHMAPLALAARMPEVYALAQLLVLTTALLSLHWGRARSERTWLLAVPISLLAVLQHPMAAVPVVVMAAVALRRRPSGAGAVATPLIALVAAAVLAYLPMAASSAPRHAWGSADSFPGFWALVSAENIRTAFAAEQDGNWTASMEYLRQWVEQFEQSSPVSPLLLAVVGMMAALLLFAARRDRRVLLGAGVLAALVVADLWWAIRVNPMGIRDAQVGGLAALVLYAFPTAFVVELATHQRSTWVVPVVGAGLSIGVMMGLSASPMLDEFDSGSPFEDAVAAVHATAPVGFAATWLSDDMTAAATWRQIALDERPDGSSFGRWLFDSPDSLAGYLAVREEPAWAATLDRTQAEPAQSPMLSFLLANLQQRALFWEVAGSTTDLPPLPDLVWAQAWPAARPGLDYHQVAAAWRYDHGPDPSLAQQARAPSSYFYRRWLASQWAVQGVRLAQTGEFARAVPFFERSTELAPESSAWANNLAFALASSGQVERALVVANAAWQSDRLSQPAWRNIQLYANHLGIAIDPAVADWGAAMEWEPPLR
jgi:hypothetical protein